MRVERRRADRRRGERRRPPRSSATESTFGPWGSDAPPLPVPPEVAAAGLEQPASGLTREARRLVSSGQGAALPRVLRTYLIARAALGLALLLAPFAATLGGARTPLAVLLVSLAYAGQAVSMWVLQASRPASAAGSDRLRRQQWASTVGVDVLAFSLLRLVDVTGHLNYSALLVLPVLMAGVLMRRRVALATTSAVVLLMLGTVLVGPGPQADVVLQLSQTGLAGAGMFVITLLANELATRLAGEERSARSSLALAAQQTLLNRVVIEEMVEGVLVVDRRGVVRTLNPAAMRLLGVQADLRTPLPLAESTGLQALRQALDRAYLQGVWPDDARELEVAAADGSRHTLQVRARFTRRAGIGGDADALEDICVMFLEDMRSVQARARQDKLAAMGRMSAGIAHEIRNPLAAIAQANALQLEDELATDQRRLAVIVADNVERLKRIVDDVLAVAAVPASPHAEVDLNEVVARTAREWQAAALPELQVARRLQVQVPGHRLMGRFDAEHLRRVMVNLLDNAIRHASQDEGAVRLALSPLGAHAVSLVVASDGEPIAPQTERHLFEPFFSTRSRGSGLGLYICRELCARHGAAIDFQPAPPTARHRNVFSLTIRRADAG